MSPKKSKLKAETMSPSPKNPIPKRSSSVSKKIILTGIVASLALVTVACLLDYQQGKLDDHTSKLPYEVQKATKYVVTLANDLPRNVEVWYEGARGQVVLLAGKMYVGDKTLAQLLFGEDVEEVDNIPEDIKKDFEVEDVIEGIKESVRANIVEENTLADLKAAEENAIKLRKDEELRIYEENKQKIKDIALKVIEEEKKADMNALLEEKAKLRAKIEAETASMKTNTSKNEVVDDDISQEVTEKFKAQLAASADEIKAKLAAQAAATYEKVLKNQEDEMAKINAGLNKKLESNIESAGGTTGQLMPEDLDKSEALGDTNQDVKLKKQAKEVIDGVVKDASKQEEWVKQANEETNKLVGKKLYEED
eukprot:GFUD01022062.1.p1 GENE.GFUD01022062.1~~GFUD01022062.1.p1  ORF type:complete len:366 (+),score=121.44 GFUD01022062.1:60-1157(+)